MSVAHGVAHQLKMMSLFSAASERHYERRVKYIFFPIGAVTYIFLTCFDVKAKFVPQL